MAVAFGRPNEIAITVRTTSDPKGLRSAQMQLAAFRRAVGDTAFKTGSGAAASLAQGINSNTRQVHQAGRNLVGVAQKHAVRLGGVFQQMGFQAQLAGQIMTRAFTVPAVAAASLGTAVGVKLAAKLESARVALKALLPVGFDVDALLNRLRRTAIQSPVFNTPQLVDFTRKLVSTGVEVRKAEKIIMSMGRVFQTFGVSGESVNLTLRAIGQSMSKGKLQAEELNQQLGEHIPALHLLARAQGVSQKEFLKMVSAGKITSDVFAELLIKIGKFPDVAKGSAASLNTMQGAWDRLKESVFDALANTWLKFSPQIQKSLKDLEKEVPKLAAAFGQLAPRMVEGFAAMVAAIREVVTWYGNLSDSQRALVNRLLLMLVVAGPVISFFSKIFTLMGALTTAFRLFLTPLGLVFGVFGALIALGVVAWFRSAASGADKMATPLERLKKAIGFAKDALDGFMQAWNEAFGTGPKPPPRVDPDRERVLRGRRGRGRLTGHPSERRRPAVDPDRERALRTGQLGGRSPSQAARELGRTIARSLIPILKEANKSANEMADAWKRNSETAEDYKKTLKDLNRQLEEIFGKEGEKSPFPENKGLIGGITRGLGTFISGLIDITGGALGGILDLFQHDFEGLWNNFWKVVAGIGKLGAGVLEVLLFPFDVDVEKWWSDNINEPLAQGWKDLNNWWRENVDNPVAEWWNGVDTWWKKNVDDRVKKWWDDLTGAFSNFFSGDGLKRYGEDAIEGFLDGLGLTDIGQWFKNNIINPFVASVKQALGIESPSTVFAAIGAAVIQGVIKGIKSGVQSLLNVFRSALNGLRNIALSVWNRGIKPVLTTLGSFIMKHVVPAFRKGVSMLGAAWNRLKSLALKPVNFVIDPVYNRGIVGTWNKVADWLGLKAKLGKIAPIGGGGMPGRASTAGLKAGGRLAPPDVVDAPGRPMGVFSRPTAIVGEGKTAHPEFVIPTEPQHRSRALKLYEALGAQLMEKGGLVGQLMGALNPLKRITGTPFGRTVAGLPRKIIGETVRIAKKRIADFFFGFDPSIGGGRGTVWPAGRFRHITSPYGANRGSYRHGGTDIAMPTGAPIFAFRSGRVVQSGWYGGGGRTVSVAHGGGLVSRYMHMLQTRARVGSRVPAGRVIGLADSTGDSTGSHLHFQVERGGSTVNPMQFFDQGGRLQPGVTPILNATGQVESLRRIRGGDSERSLELHFHGPVYADKRKFEDTVASALEELKRKGKL